MKFKVIQGRVQRELHSSQVQQSEEPQMQQQQQQEQEHIDEAPHVDVQHHEASRVVVATQGCQLLPSSIPQQVHQEQVPHPHTSQASTSSTTTSPILYQFLSTQFALLTSDMKELSNNVEQKFTQLELRVDSRLTQLELKVESRYAELQRDKHLSENILHRLVADIQGLLTLAGNQIGRLSNRLNSHDEKLGTAASHFNQIQSDYGRLRRSYA